MESGIKVMKNKVILIYKNVYDEIGGFTANESEMLILTDQKCVFYSSGSGYEGENDYIASKSLDLKQHTKFIDDCFSHILSSYGNKENIVDCSGCGGTNNSLFQVKIISIDKLDPRLLNGEIYFKNEYEVIRQYKFKEYYSIKPFVYSLAGIIPSYMWPNFIKTYIKPVKDLALISWEEEEKKLQSNVPFEGVYCGIYPQSELKDKDLIKILNDKHGNPLTNDNWLDYGYRANDYQGGYMFYIDVTLDDNKYRGVYFKEFRPNSSKENIARNFDSVQEASGYKKDNVYWFKFEPLLWIKCGANYQKQYLCLNVIDAEPMYDDDPYKDKIDEPESFYSVSSSLCRWLKDTFSKTAFSEENRPYFEIDLLSKDKYLKNFPLKNQRKPRPTDYALIKGYLPDLRSRGNDFPFVWTSSYMKGTNRMVSISKDGSIIDFHSENHGYITYTYGGVQPAFTLDYKKNVLPKNKAGIDFDSLEDKTYVNKKKPVKKEKDFFTPINKELSDKTDADSISDDDLPF